jgi:lipopolysaccharide export system protein LptA
MIALALAAALAGPSAARAQPQAASGPPNALQGFSQNRNQPIKIDAASLEVRDKDKVATFSGNVQLVQGDTVLRCKSLVVFYIADAKTAIASKDAKDPKESKDPKDPKDAKDSKDATGKPSARPGEQGIRRIEARGDVVVTQKDQKATADNGFLDMKANVITLVGNVIISQGQNVVRGDRLSVDLSTSVSKVECDKPSNCRVQALLQPSGKETEPDLGLGMRREPPKPRPPGL